MGEPTKQTYNPPIELQHTSVQYDIDRKYLKLHTVTIKVRVLEEVHSEH